MVQHAAVYGYSADEAHVCHLGSFYIWYRWQQAEVADRVFRSAFFERIREPCIHHVV
jgi:hypothetical protein